MIAAFAIAEKAIKQWDCVVGSPVFVMHRENAVFKVETSSGYTALRVHRPGYHTATEIESELQWMAHLVAAGIQAPMPCLTKNGSYTADITDNQSNRYIVDLLTWLDGVPLGKSRVPLTHSKNDLETIFFDLGRNLARMHSVSDQWAMPVEFCRHALDREGLLGETASWGKFWQASCLTKDEQLLLGQARDLAAEKIDYLAAQGADYGLIHADVVRENILISNGKTQLIDFDDAGFGFRMFDLATALVKNREEPHYETMKLALISGYETCTPLKGFEKQSLDFFLMLRDFAYLGWADARREEPGMLARLPQIKADTILAARNFLDQ